MSDMSDLVSKHIYINEGDMIHDAREGNVTIDSDILQRILPIVFSYLIDYNDVISQFNYSKINTRSHETLKLILLDNNFGQQHRYRFTELKNISIRSELQPVIFKKDVFSILSKEITKTFNDNVNPAKYINNTGLQIIDTPATYLDPAPRLSTTAYFIPEENQIQMNTNEDSYNQKLKVNFRCKFLKKLKQIQ